MELPAHEAEIMAEKLLKYAHVMECGLIDRSLYLPPHLTAPAVTVLMNHQKMRQVAVPQISVKSIGPCQIQQFMNAAVEHIPQSRHIPPAQHALLILRHQPRHILQQPIPALCKLPV